MANISIYVYGTWKSGAKLNALTFSTYELS